MVTGAANGARSPAISSRDRGTSSPALAASVMSVAYGLSFAALIFAPPLNTWLAYGIAATFIASAIGAAFVAVRSSLPFAIAAPDGATAAVTATLAATVAERLIAMVLLTICSRRS